MKMQFGFFSILLLCILFHSAQAQILDLNKASKTTVLDGKDENYVVGNIEDAKFFKRYISLIDNNDTKFLILEKRGNLIQKVGRAGRGPGEFVRPISIEAINDDLILIDESLNRITRYTYTSENGLQLKNSGTHNLNMSDMCISSGAIWVYAQSQNKIMHQISSDLNKVSKFIDGQFNIQEKPSMLEIASTGLIACNSKYIYNGFTKDNEIRIYNVNDGSLHKKIQFEEITPLKISAVSNPDGNPRFSFQYYQGDAYDDKGDYHDTLKNLTLINGHLLVQYERSFSNDESGQQHIISLYFDPKDGTYTLHKDWPLVYDYNGNNFLTGTEYPIPKLNIYMFDK